MTIKVTGIIGSARQDSNTSAMVEEALRGACNIPNVETELLPVAGRQIAPCGDCSGCWDQYLGRCPIEDDAEEIIAAILRSDGILIGTPVHVGGVSAVVKALLERCQWLTRLATQPDDATFERIKDLPLDLPLRNKVGGALAVGPQSGGQEQAIREIHSFFLINDMFVVADGGLRTPMIHTHFGGTGTVRNGGRVTDDEYGMRTAWSVGRRVAEVAAMVQAGSRRRPMDR